MAPRCRGYRSRRLQAFQDDPKLLIIRPAPPAAGLNDLKPLNLSTVLMVVHKDCYTSLNLTNKAAAAGGILQTAVMLLSVPLVVSNIPQALEGGLVAQTLWSLAPVLVGMVPGVWIGVGVLLNVDPAVAKTIAGIVVVLVAALTLLAPELHMGAQLVWSGMFAMQGFATP